MAIRHFVFMVAALIGLVSTSAFAFPNAHEMADNFDICIKSDSSWYNRFGRYVVAFDIDDATRACQRTGYPQRAHLASCWQGSGWIYAGYYCEEVNASR